MGSPLENRLGYQWYSDTKGIHQNLVKREGTWLIVQQSFNNTLTTRDNKGA